MLLLGDEIFALDFSVYRPSAAEVKSATDACINTGRPANENYACPVGNYTSTSKQALSREVMECKIQMALAFYRIDEETKTWTKQLQSSREKNFNIWNEEIQTALYNKEWYGKKYGSVCAITNWTIGENASMWCAQTTDFFPETDCYSLADRKTQALKNMGYILASKGTAKAYQNDKDIYLDAQKTKYSTLLDKWNLYLRSVGNAVSKFTAYTKNAVK